jgi:hypothetical protein
MLRRDRHPAAVVETSSGSFQAWLTVAAEDVAPDLASSVARLLAARYGGDAGAANGGQLGRLPGTTNRKAKHRDAAGRFPFALIHHARAGVDPGGWRLLEEAAAQLIKSARRPVDGDGSTAALHRRAPEEEAEEAARRIRLVLPAGAVLDQSRVDMAVARRLLARGASASYVAAVMAAGGHARGRSEHGVRDYVLRTVAGASS